MKKSKICAIVIVLLGFGLILSTAQIIALESKYKNALQVASVCEVKAYQAKLPTNQPISQKDEKDLKSLDKEFLKDFNKEAEKVVESGKADDLPR